MAGRGAKPGERRGGRAKGTPNKTTKQVKEALLEALNDGEGAIDFFVKLKTGTAEDRRTFANICARLIPSEITGKDGSPLIPEEPLSSLEVARRISYIFQIATREAEGE
ncbi:MAG: hypothetical protein IT488_10455 [Gammaproteobacteria bacterium]|nr:hypothetical protein [Gammaproteobacteria bacterium]